MVVVCVGLLDFGKEAIFQSPSEIVDGKYLVERVPSNVKIPKRAHILLVSRSLIDPQACDWPLTELGFQFI